MKSLISLFLHWHHVIVNLASLPLTARVSQIEIIHAEGAFEGAALGNAPIVQHVETYCGRCPWRELSAAIFTATHPTINCQWRFETDLLLGLEMMIDDTSLGWIFSLERMHGILIDRQNHFMHRFHTLASGCWWWWSMQIHWASQSIHSLFKGPDLRRRRASTQGWRVA